MKPAEAHSESETLPSMLLTRPKLVAFYLESLDPHFENVDRKGICDPNVLLGIALVGIPHSGLECSQRVIGSLEGLCKGR